VLADTRSHLKSVGDKNNIKAELALHLCSIFSDTKLATIVATITEHNYTLIPVNHHQLLRMIGIQEYITPIIWNAGTNIPTNQQQTSSHLVGWVLQTRTALRHYPQQTNTPSEQHTRQRCLA
jgi:hypothetical protein